MYKLDGVSVIACALIEDVKTNDFDMMICPGGMANSVTLGKHKDVIQMLKKQKARDGWYCAICAAPPIVFEPNGILENEAATCFPHPDISKKMKNQSRINEKTVISNKCITSQGPGTAAEFGFACVSALFGEQTAKNIRKEMLF